MKCGTHTCSTEATTEVFWPGQTTPMCNPCAERARGIGAAMGLTIETRPIPTLVIIIDAEEGRIKP